MHIIKVSKTRPVSASTNLDNTPLVESWIALFVFLVLSIVVPQKLY